jgi:hypothetical protein
MIFQQHLLACVHCASLQPRFRFRVACLASPNNSPPVQYQYSKSADIGVGGNELQQQLKNIQNHRS